MELAAEEPQWLNNEIIVFYMTHKFIPDVKIKGMLDMDYFEEKSNPIQFLDGKEWGWQVPANPFEFQSAKYGAYNEMVSEFNKKCEYIKDLLVDCCGVEHYDYDTFHMEMESLVW